MVQGVCLTAHIHYNSLQSRKIQETGKRDLQFAYPFVLMMVMVPAPSVCIFVHATTDFPERPAPGGVGGLFSSMGNGLSVGVGGGLNNSLLISFKVTSP